LEQFNQNLGIVVSLAPLGETQLPSGKRVLNLPVYFLERFHALAKGESSSMFVF
jgi:hypothetical protein